MVPGRGVAVLVACWFLGGVAGQGDGGFDAFAYGVAVHFEAAAEGDDDFEAVLSDPAGVRALRDGRVDSVSQTPISTAPSVSSRLSRQGPGAYLCALVTSSLTTSWTLPIARSETGIPWTACNSFTKSQAACRAWDTGSSPTKDTAASTGRPLKG